jgi:chromosome segregation and condensation protein ScpB
MEHKISQVIEAVLLSASRPIDVQEIERVFPEDEKPTREEIRQALQEIEEQCKDTGFRSDSLSLVTLQSYGKKDHKDFQKLP